ncbi:MAG: 2-oxo acid dehydrogenase subunit E2 [Mariniblastus sp.]|nr:2-oxo acid dehydrogenase subunit E2 [Mariniblastus sp.]MDG2180279.1 2-oxo acid dehydrogenase subunit E2 [Mariniblastus sp.]
MPVISVRIPQLGEGLQEALLVEFLKNPGDTIGRDDPIYVMETDKATTDVESPYDGTLVEWTVEPGTVLEIGAEIGKMEVAEGVKEMPVGHGPADAETSEPVSPAATNAPTSEPVRSTRVMIPPKTRKYLKELNLLDAVDQIPCSGKKMMPEDVDAFIASGGGNAEISSDHYTVEPLPKSQIVLNYRLGRGAKACIPVTVMTDVNWTQVAAARTVARESGGPTGFAMACWAVVQALKNHPKFRSVMNADGNSLKVFHHVNLGVAVALPGDEMVTAVIRDSDKMSEAEFYQAFANQVSAAKETGDQADESTTVTVSNIGKAGMKIGIPAIVAPAVATLAIGESFAHPVPDGDSFRFQTMVTATLSFDHRIANGVGAANFMSEVKSLIEAFEA